jgi:hypothetical protein
VLSTLLALGILSLIPRFIEHTIPTANAANPAQKREEKAQDEWRAP